MLGAAECVVAGAAECVDDDTAAGADGFVVTLGADDVDGAAGAGFTTTWARMSGWTAQ